MGLSFTKNLFRLISKRFIKRDETQPKPLTNKKTTFGMAWVGGTIPQTTGTLVLVIDNPNEDTKTQF